jgi:3-methyladenine DNA glycosylase/8-oxoguanine DNA glycosylase
MRDWRRITHRWGAPAPLGLRAFPAAGMLAEVPRFELEAMEIDAQRARTLLRFAREFRLVPLKTEMSFSRMRDLLLRVPGIGPWTTESVLGYGAGDTDAAIPGDLHLPHLVCYALAGEPVGSDERMMELLEPFRGHRFRIIRLLYASRLSVPR